MASPDKTPQPGFPPYSELAAEVVRLRERVDYLETVDMRATLEQREAEVVRLRQERDDARNEAARILSLALGKGITFDDLSVASPDKPPAGGEEQ